MFISRDFMTETRVFGKKGFPKFLGPAATEELEILTQKHFRFQNHIFTGSSSSPPRRSPRRPRESI
jgi:hypothetical protein